MQAAAMRTNASSVSSRTWIHPFVNRVAGTGKAFLLRDRDVVGHVGAVRAAAALVHQLELLILPGARLPLPVSSMSSSSASRLSALSICLVFFALTLMWFLPVPEDTASVASRSIHEVTPSPPAARGSVFPGAGRDGSGPAPRTARPGGRGVPRRGGS